MNNKNLIIIGALAAAGIGLFLYLDAEKKKREQQANRAKLMEALIGAVDPSQQKTKAGTFFSNLIGGLKLQNKAGSKVLGAITGGVKGGGSAQ